MPVNPRNYKHPRRDDILVSLSGIIMNFIVSFIAYGIYFIVVYVIGWDNMIFINIMTPIILLNITLGVFNLIPIPPLDGFHVFAALAPRQMHKFAAAIGRYSMIIVLLLLMSGVIGWLLNGFTNWVLSVYSGFWHLVA